jgi:hypothetical protein
MMNRLSIMSLIILTLLALSVNGFGQKRKPASAAASKPVLATTDLPTGGTKIKAANMSVEAKTILTKIIASFNRQAQQAGANVNFRQGNSEVISWAGYGSDSAKSEQLMGKIESSLQSAGWEYESARERDGERILISLMRTKPTPRRLIGFYMPQDDSLLLIITEVIRDEAKPVKGVNVAGKWNMIAQALGQSIPVTLELKQVGNTVSGTFSSHIGNGTIRDIKVSGNNLRAIAKVEVQGQIVDLDLEGTINGDRMNGTLSGVGLPPISFTATKVN